MTASNHFAYDRSGSIIAIADGQEILAHSGADESPLWRASCEALVVAIGATADAVFAVDADGRLARWGAKDGQPGQAVSLGATPKGLAVARSGACAVVLPDAVAIVEHGALARTLNVSGATAAAFSDDGTKLAIGSGDGIIRLFPIDAGAGTGGGAGSESVEPLGKVDIGQPVRSIAWNAGGFWIATGGDRVFRAEGDCSAGTQVTRATGMTPDCVVCSEDGSLFAVRLDASTVVTLAYPSRDTGATVQYIDKKAVGIAFGPPPFLGIGLDGGDGNKINLRTEAVHRTDTHPGRTHNRWTLSCAIDAKALPPEYAGPVKVMPMKAPAGGAAWAHASESKPIQQVSGGGSGGGGSGSSTMAILLGAGLLLVGVVLLIARCQ